MNNEDVLDALIALTADCLASDFNEHWDSYREARRLIVERTGLEPHIALLRRKPQK